MRILSNLRVPMRDDVSLAMDVYLPDSGESWPVVLERTPYGKTLHSRSEIDAHGNKLSRAEVAEVFTEQGMAVAYQDCRGRYDSEGVFEKYVNEAEDGFDTLEWIVDQDWCNGNIGTMGLSYAAHTQLAAAGLSPRGLRTMVLDSGGFDNAYKWGIRQGGTFELKQATWAFRQAKLMRPELIQSAEEEAEEINKWFSSMPWSEGNSPLAEFPEYESYVLEQWRTGTFNDYWKKPGMYNEPMYKDVPDIPILFMSSWYDVYVPSTLHNFAALRRGADTHSLIMGPWLHGDRVATSSGNVLFGEAAVFDGNVGSSWLDYRVKWFRSVLVEQQVPAPEIKIFEMGGGAGTITGAPADETGPQIEHGGRWMRLDDWPPKAAQMQTLYLGQNGSLSQDVAETGSVTLVSDPSNPVPSIGGQATSGKPVFVGGGFDQIEAPGFYGTDGSGKPLANRSDVLCFETAALEHDVVIAGSVEVEISFIADTPDFDIAAKLVDVYPAENDKSYALNITDSIMRARYRNSFEEPALLQPGERGRLRVILPETCNRFVAGHKIRLEIAGSNFPHFDVNPNSGEPEGYAEEKRIAHTQVLFGQGESALHVSVVEE